MSYTGGREVKDFVKFIAKHSTDGLKTYTRDGKKKKSTDELQEFHCFIFIIKDYF